MPLLGKEEYLALIKTLAATIWGRQFSLPVEYDCYGNEEITEQQIEAMDTFAKQIDCIEKAKKPIEDYCKDDLMNDDENQKKENIFSYIKPECVFVKRDREHPRVALMCKYRYDPEHGLAIVFSHDGKIAVGEEGIIL